MKNQILISKFGEKSNFVLKNIIWAQNLVLKFIWIRNLHHEHVVVEVPASQHCIHNGYPKTSKSELEPQRRLLHVNGLGLKNFLRQIDFKINFWVQNWLKNRFLNSKLGSNCSCENKIDSKFNFSPKIITIQKNAKLIPSLLVFLSTTTLSITASSLPIFSEKLYMLGKNSGLPSAEKSSTKIISLTKPGGDLSKAV
jgi:hypothetical protein